MFLRILANSEVVGCLLLLALGCWSGERARRVCLRRLAGANDESETSLRATVVLTSLPCLLSWPGSIAHWLMMTVLVNRWLPRSRSDLRGRIWEGALAGACLSQWPWISRLADLARYSVDDRPDGFDPFWHLLFGLSLGAAAGALVFALTGRSEVRQSPPRAIAAFWAGCIVVVVVCPTLLRFSMVEQLRPGLVQEAWYRQAIQDAAGPEPTTGYSLPEGPSDLLEAGLIQETLTLDQSAWIVLPYRPRGHRLGDQLYCAFFRTLGNRLQRDGRTVEAQELYALAFRLGETAPEPLLASLVRFPPSRVQAQRLQKMVGLPDGPFYDWGWRQDARNSLRPIPSPGYPDWVPSWWIANQNRRELNRLDECLRGKRPDTRPNSRLEADTYDHDREAKIRQVLAVAARRDRF